MASFFPHEANIITVNMIAQKTVIFVFIFIPPVYCGNLKL